MILKKDLDAIDFARSMTAYSSNDQLLDNAFGVVDVATTVPVAKLAGLLKGTVKALGPRTLDVGAFMGKMGNTSEGAVKQAVDSISKRLANPDDPTRIFKDLTDVLPSAMNTERILQGGESNFNRAALARIQLALSHSDEALMHILTDVNTVSRLNADQVEVGVRETWEKLLQQHPKLDNGVLDVSYIPSERTLDNIHTVEISLGKPEGVLFESADQASYYANKVYKLGKDSYEVKPVGNGYRLVVQKDIDETTDAIRSLAIDTDNETPHNIVNTFLGMFQGADNSLSAIQRAQRNVIVHGATNIQQYMKDSATAIGQLSRRERKDLQRFMDLNRTYQTPGTTEVGRFFTNVNDFFDEFRTSIGRPPSERETAAYFQAVKLNDLDYAIRNISYRRELARMGYENVTFRVRSPHQKTVETGAVVGKKVDSVPFDSEKGAGVYILNPDGSGQYLHTKTVTAISRKKIEQLQKKGYSVIQLSDPNGKPLSSLKGITPTDKHVHFVVVRDAGYSKLPSDLIPYRPGGHVIYPQGHFVVQPRVEAAGTGRVYTGDVVLHAQTTEAETRLLAQNYEKARQLLKNIASDGDVHEYEQFVLKNLPYSPSEFANKFIPRGDLPAQLDIESPIMWKKAGQNGSMTEDFKKAYPDIDTKTADPFNDMSKMDRDFLQERGVQIDSVRIGKNTEGNPMFSVEPSRLVDPLVAINAGLQNAISNKLLTDYMDQAAEKFIQEFYPLMSKSLAELRADPMAALRNPEYAKGVDVSKRAIAENYRRATLNLMHSETAMARYVNFARSKMMDMAFNTLGQKTTDFVAQHLLGTLTDPFTYARNVAFHLKLGLFNPLQIFLQGQSVAHSYALSPRHAIHGSMGAFLMRQLSLNSHPDILAHYAQRAEKLGIMRADHFVESYQQMLKSGIWNVGRTVGDLSSEMNPKVFESAAGRFLDKGTMFFEEGERWTRLQAWNTAYREWRMANPDAVFNKAALDKVINRYSDMALNMSRQGNAMWQRGALSVPTQFFGYYARLTDQLLAPTSRISWGAKARILATYSVMYGVPIGVFGPTFGYFPFAGDIRQAALERGYNVNEGVLGLIMNGVIQQSLAAITGTNVNIAQRFGPDGMTALRDALTGANGKDFFDLLFGASGSIVRSSYQAALPALVAAGDWVSGKNDEAHPFIAQDLLNAVRSISTVNNAVNAYYAFTTGRYLDRNGGYLGDASTADAILTGLLGTQAQSISDAFLMQHSHTTEREAQEQARKQMIAHLRRGWASENQKDAEENFRAARAWSILGDFRPDQYSSIFSQAAEGQSLVDAVNQRFWQKAPASQVQQRYEGFINRQQDNGN